MSTTNTEGQSKNCSCENHSDAAKHHEAAAMHHHEAAKHHEAGNCDKAKESDTKANEHHCPECESK